MKRVLALAAVGLAAVALYAAVAPAGQQAVTPRQFNALSAKVTKLSKKLTATTNELVALENCFNAVGVAAFGDEQGQTQGYVYVDSGGNDFLTTALDLTDAAHAQAFAVVTNSTCASALNGGKKKAAVHLRAPAHTRK
jgi:hypothetical protein